MRMNEISFEGPPPIDAYGMGGFRLGGMRCDGSLAILPDGMREWAPRAMGELTIDPFADFVAAADRIDILLLGAGAEIAPLPASIRAALAPAALGVEVMATGAACRTYTVLLAEDRRVAAALLAV